ncbi:MAG: FHA domain-containing protein [Endomicrobiales bacterium]|nr:FHA domain-containing protein [Endomicrobiales bacterium]
MPKLLLKFHAAVIKEIPAEKTPITIGRKPDNDIVIDNMAVSGHHAKITQQGATYVIEDLQSTNGTFVNDKKIINSGLKNNDNILIGQHTIVFVDPKAEQNQPEAQAPAQKQPIDSEATVVMSSKAKAAAAAEAQGPGKKEMIGNLKVIEGKLDQNEYVLSGLLTYIGKGESAAIKIKGMFAPDIAALISRRPTSYLITAVKEGYPKLNNNTVSGQIELKDGDVIEVGGIKFLFQMKEKAE